MSDPGPWYRDGLRFACTQCGHCCSGEPGHTWVDDGEIDALAAHLGLDREAFLASHARKVWRQGRQLWSLIEKRNHECIFFAPGRGCTVYALRPRQCRTWPFWRINIDTPDDWAMAGRGCPGIDRGPRHAAAAITATAVDDGLPG